MKKLNVMLFAAALAVLGFTSCSDDDDAAAFGITGVTVTTAEGVSHQGVISQADLTITVTMPVTTQTSELEACTIAATATMGTTVTIDDKALEGSTFDLSSPITLTAACDGQTKAYVLTVSCTEEDADLATGKRLTADLRNSGIPAGTYDYSVAFFKGKFYAFTAELTDSTANYGVYTSTNGIRWTELSTPEIIGGMGASPVVYNDKLYVMGGIRIIGTDKEGNAPELEIGGWSTQLTLNTFRTWTTTDGATWNNESIEGSMEDPSDMFRVMVFRGAFGFLSPTPFVFNEKLYMESGNTMSFGMFQGANGQLYLSDGGTYTPIMSAMSALRSYCSTFVLNNKLFTMCGAGGFVGPATLQTAVYSSEDGENFITASDSTAVGALCGATVVTNNAGNVAYLFGGCYYDEEGARVMNNTIYRTEDGTTWTALENINSDYAGTFTPRVVVDDNDIAYVFGGFSSFSGNYTPYATSVDDMEPSFAAWAFQLQ